MSSGETIFWSVFLKPFLLVAVLAVFGIPITMAAKRWMKDGPIKRALLDRTLMTRKPWVAWLGVFLGYVLIFSIVVAGST